MGIKRRKGVNQTGKKPLLISNLKQIINVIDKESTSEVKKLRNRTLLLLGFSGGFRRNELVSLNIEDIEKNDTSIKGAKRKNKYTNAVKLISIILL